MQVCVKLVAAMLALAVVAYPAAAIAACWSQAGGHPCLHCRTMKTLQTTATPALENPSPCCEISSSKPAPVSVLPAPVASPDVAPAQATVAVVAVPAAVAAAAPEPELLVQSTPSQAVLCVFLV